jgi:hypothetical protein
MHNPLQSKVLVQGQVTADLLPVDFWGHRCATPDRRKAIQKSDYLSILPDDVVRRQRCVTFDKAADETPLRYLLQIPIPVE